MFSKSAKLQASTNPLVDLESIAPEGQAPIRRMYKSGYELHFERLWRLNQDDPLAESKAKGNRAMLDTLAENLKYESWIQKPPENFESFGRTVLALESPGEKIGAEIVVGHWRNFSTPVHGHMAGLTYEKVLFGTLYVNTYEIVDLEKRIVELKGTFVLTKDSPAISFYSSPTKVLGQRSTLIHRVYATDYAVSLHFFNEHTRDGADNQFTLINQ